MKNIYCIPNINEIKQYELFSKKYNAGFEYNDFFLPDILDSPAALQERITQYRDLDRDKSEDTLHGVFLDICVNSCDSKIFEVSDFRIHQSMEIAKELGVKAVIFHTNHIPNFRLKSYRESWLKQNVDYWKKILNEYPTLMIYMENMFDEEPDLLLSLAQNLENEARFGVCLDVAHAYLSSTALNTWCHALSPYTRHVHINDNQKDEDTHDPVGNGTLPWNVYSDFIYSFSTQKRPSILLEVRGYKDLISSVNYMEDHKLYPFDSTLKA